MVQEYVLYDKLDAILQHWPASATSALMDAGLWSLPTAELHSHYLRKMVNNYLNIIT